MTTGPIDNRDAELAELRRRYPLPAGVEDAVVNRSQLAVAMNVSENTITKWIAAGMPLQEAGGNGREYSFALSDCYAWRMERDDQLRAQKDAADRSAAQLALAFRNAGDEDEDGAPAQLTARQILEEAEADYKYQRAAEQRGELVRTSRVRDLFEDTLVEFRTAISTLVDFAEMEFSLDPEQVDRLEKRCDNALVQARVNLSNAIGRGAEQPVEMRRGDQDQLPI